MASNKATAATVDDIGRDLHALRDDMAQLSRQMARLFGTSSDEAIGRVKARVRRMRDNFDEAVSGASERGREALSDVSENIGEALDGSLGKHPVTIAALALGLGFLFGTVWRR
jgi:ElaB/YqjD/DUF883 family membrane-anchored ribosome-binding protein